MPFLPVNVIRVAVTKLLVPKAGGDLSRERVACAKILQRVAPNVSGAFTWSHWAIAHGPGVSRVAIGQNIAQDRTPSLSISFLHTEPRPVLRCAGLKMDLSCGTDTLRCKLRGHCVHFAQTKIAVCRTITCRRAAGASLVPFRRLATRQACLSRPADQEAVGGASGAEV